MSPRMFHKVELEVDREVPFFNKDVYYLRLSNQKTEFKGSAFILKEFYCLLYFYFGLFYITHLFPYCLGYLSKLAKDDVFMFLAYLNDDILEFFTVL